MDGQLIVGILILSWIAGALFVGLVAARGESGIVTALASFLGWSLLGLVVSPFLAMLGLVADRLRHEEREEEVWDDANPRWAQRRANDSRRGD